MASVVVMPKLGLTMKEGTLVSWQKKEGDEVSRGDVLFEVSTDKLTNEVESTESGILRKLLVDEGDVIECLKPIAIIGESNEDISSLIKELSAGGEVVEENNSEATGKQSEEVTNIDKKQGRVKASPAAKKFAEQNGIDLQEIEGTGPQGRITIEDVEKQMQDSKNKVKASGVASKIAEELNVDLSQIKKDGRVMKEDVLSLCKCNKALEKSCDEKRVPMSQMRKVISSRMHQSWITSPAVTFDIKVDITNLKRVKDGLKEVCKVSYTDLLVKIVSKVLIQFPLVNCSVDGEELILRNFTNIGVAVALEEGLVVPVVKNADKKGLKEISQEIKELASKAKRNELTTDEITGGTFTITNLGMFGIESFSPIINQPEVAILGVNKITETPVAQNNGIVIKPLMTLSLTADHRAVDGSVAAQFLAKLKEFIEKPEMLIL